MVGDAMALSNMSFLSLGQSLWSGQWTEPTNTMHFMVVIIYGLLVSSGAIKDNEDKDKKVKKNVCSDVFPYFDL